MRTVFDTSFGPFGVEADGAGVTRLYFPGHIPGDFLPDHPAAPLLRQAETEIHEYLAGTRRAFTLPLQPRGGDFARRVWDHLVRTDYGAWWTYGAVARAVGRPGAARAVGAACRTNPIPLLIPCHRVVGANGALTGFLGGGLDLKRKLIALETGGPCPFDTHGSKNSHAALIR